jgi:hypothetical protein
MPTAVANIPLGTPVAVSNTGTAAAQVITTLPAVGGRLNYIRGFTVTVGIPAAAVTTTLTLSGLAGANLVYEIAQSAAAGAVVNILLPYAIPASAVNTAIVGTLAAIASGGAGSVVLYGDLV